MNHHTPLSWQQQSYFFPHQHGFDSENFQSFASNPSIPLHQTQAQALTPRNSQVFADINIQTNNLNMQPSSPNNNSFNVRVNSNNDQAMTGAPADLQNMYNTTMPQSQEIEKLKKEVEFWREVAEQQSLYAVQKDEEINEMAKQHETLKMSHYLLKKMYEAHVESSKRTRSLQQQSILRMVQENFDAVRNMATTKV